MDVVLLSRIQFALNITFHYLYPPLSIGLSLMIVLMEGLYLKTKKTIYRQMTKFWIGLFALSFALGVATGLVQIFAFGTNWSRYSNYVGDVFGSALAAEGVFAFFLEAGFIGLMLFGWNKVSPKIHYFSSICVSLGAHFSAIWIVAANSWMQTPAGFKIVGEGREARATVTEFWEVIFNPSFVDRLVHVLIGCWLTGVFIVLSVCAYYILKKRHLEFARIGMKIGLIFGAFLVVLQLFSADSSAKIVGKYQPEKLAAMEGVYKTAPRTPMGVVGYVDPKEKEVKGLKIPGLLSFLMYHNTEEPVVGLDAFPEKDWPNVPVVFQLYHLMIYMWGLMVLAILFGAISYLRKTLEKSKWVNRFLVFSVGLPFIANQVGWYTAEMGRQPWIVYRLLRTSEGVSPIIERDQVVGSIIMFIFIYILLFALFLFLLNRKIQHGPPTAASEQREKKKAPRIYRDPYLTNSKGGAK